MPRTKRNKRTLQKSMKSKKVWNMHGCSKHHKHKKGCKCYICMHRHNKSMKGGQCTACANPGLMKGGYGFYKPASPIPGPFVGNAWGPSVSQWPGVDGIGANRNYLSKNMYYQDPQTMMILGGKRNKITKRTKTKTKKHYKKGGGFIPQSLTNLGRSISFNAGSIYNTLNGYPHPVNPAPYEQQIPSAGKQILI